MPNLDFRSDTVTKPTPQMREAMARAVVGDDCYGDDPTVDALEADVAALFGREAALLLPTGTMSNQLAVALHTSPGQTLAAPAMAHVQIHEDASPARLSGVQIMPLGTRQGYSAAMLAQLVAQEACGWPPLGLVWLENTLGSAGGTVWGIEELEAISRFARAQGRGIHLDGARIWNAHVATGVPLPRYGAVADTLSVCLSKGLGAPAGSILVGGRGTIERARALRHGFGGSMRQAGVLAAPGRLALQSIDRLAADHRRATQLAAGLRALPVVSVPQPETNIVLCELEVQVAGDAESLCAPLREAGLLVYPNLAREIRFVVHRDHDDASIAEALSIASRVLGN